MKIMSTNRTYYRLLADGTCIGPTHTRAYLHHRVKAHKANEEHLRNHLSTRHD